MCVATVAETFEIEREARVLAEDARRNAERWKGTELESGYRAWERRFVAVAEGLRLWRIDEAQRAANRGWLPPNVIPFRQPPDPKPRPNSVIPFRGKQWGTPRAQNAQLAIHGGSGLSRMFSCLPLKAIAKTFCFHFFEHT